MFITTSNSNQRNLIDEMINDIFIARTKDIGLHWPTIDSYSKSSDYKTDMDDDGVILTMNIPGYNKKLIDVTVSGDKLSIEGKAHSGDTNGFVHNFTISDNLDSEEIDATVIDGVLTV